MTNLPTVEPSEKLNTSSSTPSFGGAYREFGASNNLWSSMGSEMAINAAVKRSELSGLELGKNPQGDIFPGFTKVDQAFENAYRTQAFSTLSMEGNKLVDDSLRTVMQADKLTPEIISNYRNNLNEGFKGLLEMSPTLDRGKLSESFNMDLLNTERKLQAQMIKQQKEALRDNSSTYQFQASQKLFETASSSNDDEAKLLLQDILAVNKQNFESGIISNLEREKNDLAARSSYLTGREFAKALDARQKGTIDEFLTDYSNKKPDDMSISEWLDVGQKLNQLINQQDALERRETQNIISEIDLKLQQSGMVDGDALSRAEKRLSKSQWNNIQAKIYAAQTEERTKEQNKRFVAQNWVNSPERLTDVPAKTLNEAFFENARSFQEYQGIEDDFVAQTLFQSTLSIPIPGYTKMIEGMAASGNPEQLNQASLAIESLAIKKPAFLDSISTKAQAAGALYQKNLSDGVPAQVAAKQALSTVYNQDDKDIEATKARWREFSDKTFGSQGAGISQDKRNNSLIKGVRKLANMKGINIPDELTFSIRYRDTLKKFYDEVGSAETATILTNRAMGTDKKTFINDLPGKSKGQWSKYPIEEYTGIPKQFNYITQQDTIAKISKFINEYNAIPENERPFGYEIIDGSRITEDEYLAAKEEKAKIENDALFPSIGKRSFETTKSNQLKLPYLNSIIGGFENPRNPIIRRTYEDGKVQDFHLMYNEMQSVSSATGMPVYIIGLQDAKGSPEPFLHIFGIGNQPPTYSPNKEELNARFAREILEDQNKSKAATEFKKVTDKIDTIEKANEVTKQKLLKEAAARWENGEKANKSILNNEWFSENLGAKIQQAFNKQSPKIQRENQLEDTGLTLDSTGRPIMRNQDGEFSTELSITIEDMRINDGKPTNIPTIWNGVEYNPEAAIEKAAESGQKFESFSSVKKAVAAAEKKSEKLGVELNKKLKEAKIIEEKPKAKKDDVKSIISEAATQTGVNEKDLLAFAKKESNFNAKAKSSTSSATGLFQITNKTWDSLVKKYGKKYDITKDMKNDPRANSLMVAELYKENRDSLKKLLKRDPTAQEIYLAHFAGVTTANKAIKAYERNPKILASKVFTATQIKANKELLKGTLEDVFKRLNRGL